MKLNQKGVVDFIFVAVLVVLVAAAAFTLWKINETDETVSDTQTNTSNSPSVNQNIQNDDIKSGETTSEESAIPEDWAEYSNEDLGLNFRYPSDLEIVEIPNSQEYIVRIEFNSEDKRAFQFQAFSTEFESANQVIADIESSSAFANRGASIENKETLIIDGKNAISYDFSGGIEALGTVQRVQLVDGGNSIQFESSTEMTFEEFSKVVESLTFLAE